MPSYRVVSGEVRGWNPYHGWMPIVWQDANERIRSSTQSLSQSIGEISDLVNRGSNKLVAPMGSAKLASLGSGFKMHTNIQLQIDRSALVGARASPFIFLGTIGRDSSETTSKSERPRILANADTDHRARR